MTIKKSDGMPVYFCPGCGRAFKDNNRIELNNPDGTFWGYDCYCLHCQWSGDISPDIRVASYDSS